MRIIGNKFWISILILLACLQVFVVVLCYSVPSSGEKMTDKEQEPEQVSTTTQEEDAGISSDEKITETRSRDEVGDGEEKGPNFLFFGDMMLDRNVGKRIEEKGVDYIFSGLATSSNSFLRDRDIVGANLEGAVTDKGIHYPPRNAYDFAFSPELINSVKKDYTFNFFNIANNHLADQGERGVRETRENLNDLGICFTGCRDGQVGDCSLRVETIKGEEVAFLGFSMVYSALDQSRVADLVQQASSSDLVIANVHWGVEYEHGFGPVQQNFAYLLVDNGVDIVIGHHPHVVQGMEIYKEKPIFYSLGNFVFDQYFSQATQEGLAVGIEAEEGKYSFSLHPFESEFSRVHPLVEEKDRRNFFQKFIDWSQLKDKEKEELENGRFEVEKQ